MYIFQLLKISQLIQIFDNYSMKGKKSIGQVL